MSSRHMRLPASFTNSINLRQLHRLPLIRHFHYEIRLRFVHYFEGVDWVGLLGLLEEVASIIHKTIFNLSIICSISRMVYWVCVSGVCLAVINSPYIRLPVLSEP